MNQELKDFPVALVQLALKESLEKLVSRTVDYNYGVWKSEKTQEISWKSRNFMHAHIRPPQPQFTVSAVLIVNDHVVVYSVNLFMACMLRICLPL